MKTRREFIQGLIVSVGGVAALSACDGEGYINATSPDGTVRFYDESEWQLVEKLADLIIPTTETVGASDVNVVGYLDGLMSAWANEETQVKHLSALKKISVRLNETTNGNFLSAGLRGSEDALIQLDTEAFSDSNDWSGYRDFKSYVTSAYFATERGATEELKWVAIPGRWDPSVELT
tara:strand:- start:2628 stop:3161 length:534 start_codon:yes stop_codon:yes gene_type:complete